MSDPPSKRQKTTSSESSYELIYWRHIPGRGEHIRLCFEATGTPYTDILNHTSASIEVVYSQISTDNLGDSSNPPPFAPPILRHGSLLLSQTPNILLYLGPRLGLVPDLPDAIYRVNALALTALDGLSNEIHDVHHPIATGWFYEEQQEEAKKKAKDYIAARLPKFLGYFTRVLKGEASKGGQFLYGGQLSYADLVLFQCVDGVSYALPKAIKRLKEEGTYKEVFELVQRVRELENIKNYLASKRRRPYSEGIYRHYPELDEE